MCEWYVMQGLSYMLILSSLVQGRLPFRAKDQAGLFKAIVRGVYDPLPDSFSAPLKHIMKGMLMVNPVSFSTSFVRIAPPCFTFL